jgi:hypothetical protein
MYIVTGASDNHYLSLVNFINSFIQHNAGTSAHTLIIYDLGIDDVRWNELQTTHQSHNFIYKRFDYSKYPEWFNIEVEAGQYAWKPTIIYNTCEEFPDQIIVWMDAGNLIHSDLKLLETFLQTYGVYSSISSGSIRNWTHPATIEYLQCQNVNEQNRNAACLGFKPQNSFARELLTDFYQCCLDKNCIAPNGSSRLNHRQDQAVFTVLLYKALYKHNNRALYAIMRTLPHLGYSIHNDVE